MSKPYIVLNILQQILIKTNCTVLITSAAEHRMVQGTVLRNVFRYLCEDVVGLAEDPACVCVRGDKQLQRPDVNVGAQGPEMRFL